MAQGAYGERLRETFKVRAAPVFVTRTLKKAKIAVTEIRCDIENNGLSEKIPSEDAMLMMIQVRDVPAHDLFLDGRQLRTDHLPVGTANIYDLRTVPVANRFAGVGAYCPVVGRRNQHAADQSPKQDGDYDYRFLDCQEAIEDKIQQVMEEAIRAGWTREEAAAALVEVADLLRELAIENRTANNDTAN